MAEEIRDISLSTKRAFSIDGDLNRIIHIDTSDLNILARLEETYPKIQKLAVEASEKVASIDKAKDDEDDTVLSEYVKVLKSIDKDMREMVDYIFASPIADICVPDANMYDPVNGGFRYEDLIDKLSRLYANNLTAEFKKMQDRVKKHTEKYANRRNKK